MVAGNRKSRSLRRVVRSTPGGKNITLYKKRKHSKPTCPVTGERLKGVPTKDNVPKSMKRPERPYGGVLSSRAMRRKLIAESREA